MKDAKEAAAVDMGAVPGLLERLRSRQLGPEDYALVERVVLRLLWVTGLVQEGRTKLTRLQRLLGFSRSEKTAAVVGRPSAEDRQGGDDGGPEGQPRSPGGGGGGAPDPPPAASDPGGENPARPAAGEPPKVNRPKARIKGHGRLPASAYPAARHIKVAHEALRPGDTCPMCGRGTLYELAEAAQVLRIFGQAPLQALCWDCQRLRCSACGLVHTARAPAAAQGEKYDESATSLMAFLRFSCGVPHHRLEQLQADLQTPVPASTQWEAMAKAIPAVAPAHAELIRQAAQAPVLHVDDSHGPVLAWTGKRRAALLAAGKLDNPERTGIFTTAVVAITAEDRKIAIFFNGRKHAGENLADLLNQRAAGLSPPICMSDALAGNTPAGHSVIPCNCLVHGRRNFVDVVGSFPEECRHFLEQIGRVFEVDALCREEKLSGAARLERHQRESAPVMAGLQQWMKDLLEQKRTEPSSGLGKAINYMLKRWDRFTLFLRRPGVPLENNVAERVLKMAIRHRNNSLFYLTAHGAEVGDVYMSLIHTARLCGENPVAYLTAIQHHARAVAESPQHWMPWNWRATLADLAGDQAHSEAQAA